MVDRTLADFVKEALARGAARDEIERALAQAGWPADQAKNALAAFADAPFVIPVPLPRPYVSAREAFLYLVLFIALGVVATHLGGLLFALIEMFLPRTANPAPYQVQQLSSTIRWAVSALVVALPLHFVLTWRLVRLRRRNPAMQASRIRKWLTYLALVIAAGTLLGDIIFVVYSFLAGELTMRFLLKAAVIAAIAGAIFLYYVRDAERDDDRSLVSRVDALLAAGVAATTIIASVVGVSMIDSPDVLRAKANDDDRLDAVAQIAGAVDCYYTYEGELPESLAAMRASLDARAAASTIEYACRWQEQVDPVTGAPYEYSVNEGRSYDVCAVFERATEDGERTNVRTDWLGNGVRRTFNAAHGEGRHCFTLEAKSLDE